MEPDFLILARNGDFATGPYNDGERGGRTAVSTASGGERRGYAHSQSHCFGAAALLQGAEPSGAS
jgi:hypothetical protein